MLYAVYLTHSRGALLGLGVIVYFLLRRRVSPVVGLGAAALVLAALYALQFTGGRDITVDQGRMVAWGAGIHGFLSRPIFGIGFNHFTDFNDLTAHNSFVLCFAELGLFGYFFWMALLYTTIIGINALGKRLADKDPLLTPCVISVQTAITTYLLTGWFLSRTYQPTLYILLALAGNMLQMRPEEVPRPSKTFQGWAGKTVALELASIVLIYVLVKLRRV
jgi:putative inorganic carbon (HCO3(-)) transporter